MVKKAKGRAQSLLSISGRALAVSVLWTLLAAAIIAKLIDAQVLSMEQMGYAALAVLLISGAVAAYLSIGKSEKPLTAVGASLLGYLALLLGVNGLFFGGGATGLGVDAAALVAGAATVCLLHRKGRGGAARSRYKTRHR